MDKITFNSSNKSIVVKNKENIQESIDLLNSWVNSDQDKLFKATYAESTQMVKTITDDLNKFLEESAAMKNIFLMTAAKIDFGQGKYDDFKEMLKYMLDKNAETHKHNLVTSGNSLMDLAEQFGKIYDPNDSLDVLLSMMERYNSRVTSLTRYKSFDHPTIQKYSFKNFLLGRETLMLRLYIRGIEIEHLQ